MDEHGDEGVYEALSTADDDGRWAFGTGFDAGPAEITAPAPEGVDRDDLATYCLMLADDALVASQRLAEWTTNAPELEEEVALANIALDLLGQARVLLSRAGHLGAAERYRTGGAHSDEDVLAYFRDERAFRNVVLAESDLGDFGRTMAWMLVFSAWRLALMTRLGASRDPVVAAVADKAVKELAYQRQYAAQWVLRLGDGTPYSHERMQAGLDAVWPFVEELFTAHPVEARLVGAGVAVDPAELRGEVDAVLEQVLPAAGLTRPERPAVGLVAGRGGRDGIHTEALGPVLAVMQSLARAHPEATW
jgi:ring-1,2-phenylacetyl-CoA epoxidase subunit PaaC